VNYRDANTVYRSLSAGPAPLDVARHSAPGEKLFGGKLSAPQAKNPGQVAWTEAKVVKGSQNEPQPYPIPLIVANAPHQSFLVESNPVSKVVGAVHELFQQQQVDFVFNSGKFKWKCACYDGETETRFVSRLFSVPDKVNFFVLDFQRRAGDPFHFQSIYKAINFRLLKSGFIVCNDNKSDSKAAEEPSFRTFKPLALPDDFFVDGGDLSDVDLEPLFRMCSSPYIDVQREGLSALATQIGASDEARKIAVSFGPKLMEIVSLSRDPQVRRLAASAIAKLSAEESARHLIASKGGVRVLVNMLINQSETLETRRHVGGALLQLSDWDASSVSLMKSMATTSDARLDQIVRDLHAKH